MKCATIEKIYPDGVTLRFDTGDISQKRYKVNKSVQFHEGDRVRITEVGSSYIVEYPIGNPKME